MKGKDEGTPAACGSPSAADRVVAELIVFVREQVAAQTLLGEAIHWFAQEYADRRSAPSPSAVRAPEGKEGTDPADAPAGEER